MNWAFVKQAKQHLHGRLNTVVYYESCFSTQSNIKHIEKHGYGRGR